MHAFAPGALDQLQVLRDIVSGQIDADRTDYLLRDSHHCGVDYGLFDYRRMIEEHMARSATVIAGTYCELVEIDVPRFLALVANTPAFSLTVLRVIARRLRVMNRRYRDSTRHL